MGGAMEEVLVAGAGIVGVSTAIWLQRAGFKVTLVDRLGPAAETSHGNAGVLASAALTPVTMPGLAVKAPFMLFDKYAPLFLKATYLPRLLPFLSEYLGKCNQAHVRRYTSGIAPLVHDATAQHRALAKGTGAEAFIIDTDYAFGYADEEGYEADRQEWDLRREWGISYDVLSGADYGKIDPIYEVSFKRVVRCHNHGRITDPGAYVKALAAHFIEQGGIIEIAAVTDIRQNSNGRAELITDKGVMSADKIALTAGVWSKALLAKFHIRIPLESERGYHIELVNPDCYPVNSVMVVAGKFAVSPLDGRIRCGGVVEFAGLKAGMQQKPLAMLSHHIKKIFPHLRYDEEKQWFGHRPALVDSLPMIGQIADQDRLYTAFGHQHLGLTAGAKTGRLMAQIMADEAGAIDMHPYATTRF